MASIPILPVKSFLEFLKSSPSWFKVQNFSDLSWEPPSTFEKGISNHKKLIDPTVYRVEMVRDILRLSCRLTHNSRLF
jgi:hypothetical protein